MKVVIRGKKPDYMNGEYKVTHNGREMKIIKTRKNIKGLTKEQMALLKKTPVKNLNIKHMMFKKLGIEMSAGGTMFVPRDYPKSNFKGLTFKKISEIQKKY